MRYIIVFLLGSVTVGLVKAEEAKSFDNDIMEEVNVCEYPEDCTKCTDEIENVSHIQVKYILSCVILELFL